MPDWTKSMKQTYEYYIVDPGTWKDIKLLDVVKSSSITRDSELETRGSATIDVTDSVGECYIRVYLITVQNGIREKHPLGTFLVQTPSSSFNGKIRNVSMDAYTPLIELKENQPPIGYYIPAKEKVIIDGEETEQDVNVMEYAYRLTREHVRAPVVKTSIPTTNHYNFVADTSDTWLSFLSDFMASQLYNYEDYSYNEATGGLKRVYKAVSYKYDLDEMGRILFVPDQDVSSMQPVWTYNDDNSSILYPDLSMDHDLYGIPNVVEIVYSNGSVNYYSRVVNDNPDSPVSTINRGREIVYRVTDPDLVGEPSQIQLDEYAEQMLEALSSPEYTITYTHGYCPVRVGDCIRLNYTKAGLTNIKAKVISQSIKCVPGCPVTEKAVFTAKLWR